MAKKEVVEDEKKAKSVNKPDKKPKDKRPNFFVSLGKKFKDTFSELKRVTWPTFPQALKATGVVIAIVAVFLLVVTGVNYGFSELLKLLTNLGSNLG